ncbi:hypothetical protein LDG_5629 [Legionella drancourtii LLAP12]|uniref:Uncharacterized protein n=1 Tax=Legionella drancourtii LLAP12 TaxID=658187 RepID=G9EKA6_9GAMM|nr:hypothetical protein LDG_5629 [Legionella drancourtii LLAP12]
MGLIKKPTAKMAEVFNSWLVKLPLGKKIGAKYKENEE